MEFNNKKVKLYRFSHSYFEDWWLLLFLILFTFLMILFAIEHGRITLLQKIVLTLTFFAILIRIFLSSWHKSIYLRYVNLFFSRLLGTIWSFLKEDKLKFPIIIVFVIFLSWVRYVILGNKVTLTHYLKIDIVLKIITTSIITYIIIQAYHLRDRIIISEFNDYTGNENLKTFVAGISYLLSDRLVRLSGLYKIIDEATPDKTKSEQPNVAINVDDPGKLLQNAVSSDTTIKLGPLKVPVGFIMSLFSKIVRGPQICGSMNKEDGRLILIAQISGGGKNQSWQVSYDKPGDCPVTITTETLSEMLDQLTCRIVAYLVHVGSPRWQAVKSFSEGLRQYRETLLTKRDRYIHLQKAEKAFIKALAEDNKFTQCYYNLGIVYRDLGRIDSALSLFWQAVNENPGDYKSYLALANIYLKKRQYTDCVTCCQQVIELQPFEARAWNLLGVAICDLKDETAEYVSSVDDWKKIISIYKTAVSLSWWKYCQNIRKGKGTADLKNIAHVCTSNLALAYSEIEKRKKSIKLLKQSIFLNRADVEPYFELGNIYFNSEDYKNAIENFQSAIKIERRMEFWAYLAISYAFEFDRKNENKFRKEAWYTYQRVWDDILEPEEDFFRELAEAMEKINMPKEAERVKSVHNFYNKFEEKAHSTEYINHLKNMQREYRNWNWAYIQIIHKLAKEHLSASNIVEAEKYLREAIAILKKETLSEINERFKEIKTQIQLESNEVIQRTKLTESLKDISNKIKSDSLSKTCEDQNFIKSQIEKILSTLDNNQLNISWLQSEIDFILIKIENKYDTIIKELGLYGLLASAILKQKNPDTNEALLNAERAVAVSPLSAWARSILAEVYMALNDFERAELEWKICLDLNPDADTIINIARTYWERGRCYCTSKGRQEVFKRVINLFDHSVNLLQNVTNVSNLPSDSTQHDKFLKNLSQLHYWLGQFHIELMDYDKAIQHYKIAEAMDFEPLKCQLAQAYCLLEAKLFDDAEDILIKITEKACEQIKQMDSTHKNIMNKEKEQETNSIMLESLLCRALIFSERCVNLKKAKKLARCAKHYIKKSKISNRTRHLGAYYECIGWILFREEKMDAAIKYLEKSVEIRMDASAYYRLAQVYIRKSKIDLSDRSKWLKKARNACSLTQAIDLRQKYNSEVTEIQNQLNHEEELLEKSSNGKKIIIQPMNTKPASIPVENKEPRMN